MMLMRPMVRQMRDNMGLRVLPYIEEFMEAPPPAGFLSTMEQYERAKGKFGRILKRIGVTCHPEKGHWEWDQRMDHFGVH